MNYARNTFHKAAEGMLRFSGNPLANLIREHLILSQKFIIPDAGKMTVGRRFDDFKNLMRLPYPLISLLREQELHGVPYQQICMACAPEYVNGLEEGVEFFVFDVISTPSGLWAPTRPVGVKFLANGIQRMEIPSAREAERSLYGGDYKVDDQRDGWGPLNALSELFVMLSLKNVSTKVIPAPDALNKKRAKSGKLPLYDYHVLVVDGSEVYGRDTSIATDKHIRSHFRRGHIRRIGDGQSIWVRATFVHGSARGFVDKDYRVDSSDGVQRP